MDKIINSEPAKYSKTDTSEADALAVFNFIIDRKQVKIHLQQRDKIPNYDGNLEITKDDQTPIGKLEVQMKKLDEGNKDNPKYQCELSFLSYCEQSLMPILLVVVDTKNNLAYWLLINKGLLSTVKPKDDAKSVNIDIPKSNIIKEKDTTYISAWIKIIEEYKEKLFSYDSLNQENNILQSAYNDLAKKTEESLGEENDEFIEIHRFLDILNHELDINYSIIKEIYYNSVWKLGFAYADYKTDSVTYSLYPIKYNKNDLQIKKVSRERFIELGKKGFGFTGHYQDNPIKNRFEKYTQEWLLEKLKPLFENKAFPIKNEIISREFIFAFIREFKDMLNITEKDAYLVSELKDSLMNDLPLWIDEGLNFRKIFVGREGFVNIDYILSNFSEADRIQISKKVKERLEKKEYLSKPMPIGSKKYSLGILFGLLKYLEEKGIKEVSRFYLPRDYSRLKEKKSYYIWDIWSPKDVKENVQRFFKEYAKVHDDFIKSFFPNMLEQFIYFKDFDRVIIILHVKEKYESWQDGAGADFYYLKNKNRKENLIEVYLEEEEHPFKTDKPEFHEDIIIGKEVYSLKSSSVGILRFIFEDLPMMGYLYQEVLSKFETYLKER